MPALASMQLHRHCLQTLLSSSICIYLVLLCSGVGDEQHACWFVLLKTLADVMQASDSGADAAGDSACISGAESSGRDSSSSSGEPDHGQQHTSPAALDQRRQPDREQPRSRQQQPQQQRHAPAQPKGKQQDAAVGKVTKIKIPKLPMVEYAKKWYRAKVLKDACSKVLLEYQGYSHEGGPFWLAKDHSRIWRGSYKGRDWKYLVSWGCGMGERGVQGSANGSAYKLHTCCGPWPASGVLG
jgi:hypothetical protein